MLTCNVNLCYFVCYTTVDLVILCMAIYDTFILLIIPELKAFTEILLVSEMLGKYFTETRHAGKPSEIEYLLVAVKESLPLPIHDLPLTDKRMQGRIVWKL